MGRQQFPRSSIQVPLRHTVLSPSVEHTGMGWTRNLSEGGACMEVAEAVPLDAVLRLRFQTDRGAIEAEAVVVWAAAPAGGRGPMLHGVAFTRMATDQRQTLRALLRTQARARHTGARFSADLPVAYQALNQAGPPRGGWMENVSRGGMLLNLHELLHPGTRLRVTWQVASEQLTVEGTIVWVESREGRTPIRHGFRFTALD